MLIAQLLLEFGESHNFSYQVVRLLDLRKEINNEEAATSAATPSESQHQMNSGFFLDIVVRDCLTILKLLAGKYESLLVRRYALLVLNPKLQILYSITWANFRKGYSFASK